MAIAFGAQAYTGVALAKHANVSITEARDIALKADPGKVTDEELEKEAGGSGMRYSFDIVEAEKKERKKLELMLKLVQY